MICIGDLGAEDELGFINRIKLVLTPRKSHAQSQWITYFVNSKANHMLSTETSISTLIIILHC